MQNFKLIVLYTYINFNSPINHISEKQQNLTFNNYSLIKFNLVILGIALGILSIGA